MLCNMSGENLEWVCTWWAWEISPTLSHVPVLIQRKVEIKKTLPLWISGSSNFYTLKAHGVSVAPQFLIIIIFVITFFYILFIRKTWHDGYLSRVETWGEDARSAWYTYLTDLPMRWRKMQELSYICLEQSFAFVLLSSSCIYLPMDLTKERCLSVGVIVCCSLVVYFIPCKGLVDNKYSMNV
jgi:hypothetical protein